MRKAWSVGFVAAALAGGAVVAERTDRTQGQGEMNIYPELAEYVTQRQAEFDQISAERKRQLSQLSDYLRKRADAGDSSRLIFVCTHNSRRSHMAQLWAAVAAEVYGVPVATYSGGTEATAFNPRAVAALQRAGFRIEKTTQDKNAIYHARFSAERPALTCFSKQFSNAPNPQAEFGAVMVCSDADRSCPTVAGADCRFAIPYVDPKVADGTKLEHATYDERCAQIAREMLFVMRRAAD